MRLLGAYAILLCVLASPVTCHTMDSVRVHTSLKKARPSKPCRFASVRPAYSVTCPPTVKPNPVATVVTSYLHTPSKRSTDVYLDRMRTFFTLQASIVAYVDYAYVQTTQHAARHPDDTIIVPITFAQFRTLACGLGVWLHEHAVDCEKDSHTPTLYPIWAEKATMVVEAAKANCFGSNLFVWLDVGYFSETPVPTGPFPTQEGARSVPPGTVLLLAIDTPWLQRIADAQFDANRTLLSGVGHDKWAVTLGGGGFAGDVDAVFAWERAYLRMLDRYRARGWYAGKDQNLFATVCVETPTLCTLHDSELRWYDLVPLLAGTMKVKRWQPASVGGRLVV